MRGRRRPRVRSRAESRGHGDQVQARRHLRRFRPREFQREGRARGDAPEHRTRDVSVQGEREGDGTRRPSGVPFRGVARVRGVDDVYARVFPGHSGENIRDVHRRRRALRADRDRHQGRGRLSDDRPEPAEGRRRRGGEIHRGSDRAVTRARPFRPLKPRLARRRRGTPRDRREETRRGSEGDDDAVSNHRADGPPRVTIEHAQRVAPRERERRGRRVRVRDWLRQHRARDVAKDARRPAEEAETLAAVELAADHAADEPRPHPGHDARDVEHADAVRRRDGARTGRGRGVERRGWRRRLRRGFRRRARDRGRREVPPHGRGDRVRGGPTASESGASAPREGSQRRRRGARRGDRTRRDSRGVDVFSAPAASVAGPGPQPRPAERVAPELAPAAVARAERERAPQHARVAAQSGRGDGRHHRAAGWYIVQDVELRRARPRRRGAIRLGFRRRHQGSGAAQARARAERQRAEHELRVGPKRARRRRVLRRAAEDAKTHGRSVVQFHRRFADARHEPRARRRGGAEGGGARLRQGRAASDGDAEGDRDRPGRDAVRGDARFRRREGRARQGYVLPAREREDRRVRLGGEAPAAAAGGVRASSRPAAAVQVRARARAARARGARHDQVQVRPGLGPPERVELSRGD